ncbi:MAG: AN1-type zinc finger domain-containing protein [Candidatus Bathyarchaeia archaeon]
MPKCEQCGKEVDLPFECKFCRGHFCIEHRLPENHNCPNLPPRTPLGSWQTRKAMAIAYAKKASEFVSEGDYHFERKQTSIHNKYDARNKRSLLRFQADWRTKELWASLKLWFPLFWVIVGVLYLAEGSDPTAFYKGVPDLLKYMLYIFAGGIGGWTGYRIFDKIDVNTTSDRGLFGLKILSGILFVTGVFGLLFGLFYHIGFLTHPFSEPTLSLTRTAISTFIIVLSLAFLLMSAYLLFKFERRSGIIVYRR